MTNLTAPMTASATVATVANNSDFLQGASVAYPAYIQIDDEIMRYTAPPPNGTSFNPVTRGVADPVTGGAVTTAVAHTAGTKVRTLGVSAMDSFLGFQVTNSTAGFGGYAGTTFLLKMFSNMPKFLSWNYSFLTGQLIYLKFFILYPLSAGFAVAMGYAMLLLAMGAIKFF